MTKGEAKVIVENFELIKAYAEGAQMQYKFENRIWIDIDELDIFDGNEYRIKKEEVL